MRSICRLLFTGLVVVIPAFAMPGVATAQSPEPVTKSFWDEEANGPLPRTREGGAPPDDPSQPDRSMA